MIYLYYFFLSNKHEIESIITYKSFIRTRNTDTMALKYNSKSKKSKPIVINLMYLVYQENISVLLLLIVNILLVIFHDESNVKQFPDLMDKI
jgi:hypothetical protein